MDTHEIENNHQGQGALVRRDFGGTSMMRQSAAVEALVAKSRADIEARWTMALHRPRNLDNVRQDIMRECRRPGFAEAAIYERPVGRKYNEKTEEWEEQTIEGLSIRFAEVAARCMTNVAVETQTIFDNEDMRIVRVTATDLECNQTWSRDLSVKKEVERKRLKKGQQPIGERTNSYGERVFIVEATDDEVSVKEAAAVSKAARTLILRLIPGHIQDEAMTLCKKTASDRDAKDPDAARNRVLDAFAGLSVKPSDLERYLGHSTEQTSPAEIERLRKLYSAITEGEATWQDALDAAVAAREARQAKGQPAAAPAPKASTKGSSAVKDKLRAEKAEPKTEAKTAPAAAADAPKVKVEGSDPETEPGWMDGGKKGDGYANSPPPREGYEDRQCARCQVVIEVPKTDPPGAICYACSQS